MSALPLAAAIVPSLLLLWYFQSRDIYPEPPRVIWATFFLGILAIPGILLLALPMKAMIEPLAVDPYRYGLAEAFLCAAIPEELGKFLVLYRYSARHREFNEPMDGVIYGVAASLGFATLENILYVSSHGMGVAVLRALTAVPGHAFTGAVMGYFVGRALFVSPDAGSGARGRLLGLSLLAAILLHGLYDYPLLVAENFHKLGPGTPLPGAASWLLLLTLVTLIAEWRLAVQLTRGLRNAQHAGLAPQRAIPAAPVGPRRQFSLLGWLQILTGGVLSTGGGGLMLLLFIGLFTNAGRHKGEPVNVLIGGAVLGLLPFVLGIFCFRAGVARLNRAPLVA